MNEKNEQGFLNLCPALKEIFIGEIKKQSWWDKKDSKFRNKSPEKSKKPKKRTFWFWKNEYFDSSEQTRTSKLMALGSKLDIFGAGHHFKDPRIFADTEIKSRKCEV